MAATVRMPDGTSIKYNDVNSWEFNTSGWCKLLQKVDEKTVYCVAIVPPTALIEWVRPCAINGTSLSDADIIKEAVRICERKDRRTNPWGSDFAKLKALLKNFNRNTTRWK